jgi:ATP-dependent Clp protease ATP-binding subunit ClpX
MLRVLTEPRNAIEKQYQALFEMDGLALKFQPEALDAIVALAMKRKTGARGLRAAMEHVLQAHMYSLPSRGDVAECVITRETVESGAEPMLVLKKGARKKTA